MNKNKHWNKLRFFQVVPIIREEGNRLVIQFDAAGKLNDPNGDFLVALERKWVPPGGMAKLRENKKKKLHAPVVGRLTFFRPKTEEFYRMDSKTTILAAALGMSRSYSTPKWPMPAKVFGAAPRQKDRMSRHELEAMLETGLRPGKIDLYPDISPGKIFAKPNLVQAHRLAPVGNFVVVKYKRRPSTMVMYSEPMTAAHVETALKNDVL